MQPSDISETTTRIRRRARLLAVGWLAAIGCLGAALLPGTQGATLVLLAAGLALAAAAPMALVGLITHALAESARAAAVSETLLVRLRQSEAEAEVTARRLRKLEIRPAGAPPSPPRPTAKASAKATAKPATSAASDMAPAAPLAPAPEADHHAAPSPTNPAQTPAPSDQPDLPLLDAQPDALSLSDKIKALNFPADPGDTAGFDILSRALASHDLSRMLQASEDMLNYLAHLGLYMDDLLPAPASADDWRQFARGGAERAELMPLQGITDTAALDTVQEKMRADPVFRDCALHFQRMFDRMLHAIATEAADTELLDLVDTRTGRAFVLMVQVSGRS